jgi:hypothetical protein
MFGLNHVQIQDAAKICHVLGKEWKGLVAGYEGYDVEGRGSGSGRVWQEDVRWGDQVGGISVERTLISP